MSKLTIYDLLRIGHVKRWHNVNTTREQTLAEHSYMVTMISLHIASQISPDHEFHRQVMMYGLFHDAPEVVLGDTPTPAKKFIRDFTNDAGIFKKMEFALMPELIANTQPQVIKIVTLADKIEAAYWIAENGVGKHAEIVKTANWRNLEDHVARLDEQDKEVGVDWYALTNEILMALGMRYVHKASRITPP